MQRRPCLYSEAAAAGEDETQPIDTDVLSSGGGDKTIPGAEMRSSDERLGSDLDYDDRSPPPQLRSIDMLRGCRSVDEFERLNKIDEGTYGVLYRARDKKSGEIVALKRVKMVHERDGFPMTSRKSTFFSRFTIHRSWMSRKWWSHALQRNDQCSFNASSICTTTDQALLWNLMTKKELGSLLPQALAEPMCRSGSDASAGRERDRGGVTRWRLLRLQRVDLEAKAGTGKKPTPKQDKSNRAAQIQAPGDSRGAKGNRDPRDLRGRLCRILKRGRRIIIVGHLNISPYPIDSCDPGPKFDTDPSRQWFRSLLVSEGGAFSDSFRVFHPEIAEAYTCWSQASGAEEFNYGSRIDHVLIAGPCAGHCQCPDGSHENSSCDGFAECGTDMCDILLEFKRAKLDTLPRSRSCYSALKHYLPFHHMKLHNWLLDLCLSFALLRKVSVRNGQQETTEAVTKPIDRVLLSKHESSDKMSCTEVAVHGQSSSLTDEIQQSAESCDNNNCSEVAPCGESAILMDMSDETPTESSQQSLEKLAAGWERLKSLMSRNLLSCKGHGETCVVRTVKKAGPNLGRGFYVCTRAKGPASTHKLGI
ncbi:hypothetical protein SELMODRAFT_405855 [Selaginella moellendorffii]|uniref:GRF-type domain-containing protein n=1 Tax=Selaginella moellendorffii TaxID=88036 RepID=D8QZW7_SELML|nr:hypothetical protein SELMODRAFT_405855 [Selaginella moellendorffii]